MPTINYATQYSKALAQAFPYVLYFGALYNTPNNSTYKVIDANTIQIPVISTNGRKDGDRDNITSFSRNVDNKWETKVLTNHREWDTLLHPNDVNQTNQVLSIQNATKVMNETQKFPEMDAYCVSKIYADLVALGVMADKTALTNANVLSIFDKYMQEMDEARIPQSGRILYVTPTVKTLLKQAKEIVRNIDLKDGSTMLNRNVTRLDEVEIISVPSNLMQTVFDFSNGWVKGSTAKQINMLLIHPLCVYTPVNYSFASLEAPSAHSKGKYLYYEESFEDTFILNERKDGIKFNISA